MKHSLLRSISILLGSVLAFNAIGCSQTADTTVTDAVLEEGIVAKVGDYTVTYDDLADYYQYYMEILEDNGIDLPSTDAEIEQVQDDLLDDYITTQKKYYYADLYGITLSESDLADVQQQADDMVASYMATYIEQARATGMTSEDDINLWAQNLFMEDLVSYGYSMNYDEYCQYIYDQFFSAKRLDLLEEYIHAQAPVTDEQIQSYYEKTLSSQQELYGMKPGYYLADEESYEMSGGTPRLYIPEGYSRIKVLYLAPVAEANDTVSEEEAASANLAHAEAIYATLSSTSFDEALLTYGTDPDYADYPVFLENGKLYYADGDDGWEDAIHEAVPSLQPGKYSELLPIGNGAYAVVYLVSAVTPGIVPLAEVQAEMEAVTRATVQDTYYEEVLAKWKADDSMVVVNRDAIRDIGK